MEIKIFSMKGCPHCDNLKNKLKENKIDNGSYSIYNEGVSPL